MTWLIWVHMLWPLVVAVFSGMGALYAAALAGEWSRRRIIWGVVACLFMLLAIARAAEWGFDLGAARHGDRAAFYHLTGELT